MSSDFEVEPEDELLMHSYATLPSHCKKYWAKRYSLFSRFDDGVYMTAELWYSVTSEITARVVAKIVRKLLPECESVLDVCCGGGGNTIQFSTYFRSVVGIDVNPNNVTCARRNCQVYGVSDKCSFITGDWRDLCQRSDWVPGASGRFDFAFCSPPWGGPAYKRDACFDLDRMLPLNLLLLCESMARFSNHFGLFLPRNLDFSQISHVTTRLYGGRCKSRIVCLWQSGRPLGLLVIFGSTYSRSIYD